MDAYAIIDRTGFTKSQVLRIIYGTQNTSASNLFAVASAIEVHIMELFIFDFKIQEYDVGFDFYRKEVKDKTVKPKKDKVISAAEVIKIFAKEKRFIKTDEEESEMTLRMIVNNAKTRFRPDFKDNEFSSALRYAIKTSKLKRYQRGGSGPYVYYQEE